MTKKGKIISAIALSLTIVGVGALFISTYVLPIINAHRQLNEDLSNINNNVLKDVSLNVNQDNSYSYEQDSDATDFNRYWHWDSLTGNANLVFTSALFTGWTDGSTYNTWSFSSNEYLSINSDTSSMLYARMKFTQNDYEDSPLPVATIDYVTDHTLPSGLPLSEHIHNENIYEIGFDVGVTGAYILYFLDIYDNRFTIPLSSYVDKVYDFTLTFHPFRMEDFINEYNVWQSLVALPYDSNTTILNQYNWMYRNFKLTGLFSVKYVYIDGEYFEWYSILDGIELLRMGFSAIQTFLDFQILPNITLGAIVVIPFIATLLIGLIKIIKG